MRRGFRRNLHAGRWVVLKEFCSSPRKLATVFRQGRDAWKSRAQGQKQRAKALDGKVRDLTRSRDRWKAEAKKLKRQVRELEQADRAVAMADAGAEPAASTGTLATRGGSAAPPFCPLPSGKVSGSL